MSTQNTQFFFGGRALIPILSVYQVVMFKDIVIDKTKHNTVFCVLFYKRAKSAGAVECTDCITEEGCDNPMSVLDMTLNNPMVRFQ